MLAVGTVIGMRYRILGVLGRGGMGTVYRAEHLGLRRQVALKLLDPSFAAANLDVRFEREAHTAARLDHPGCVRVFDHGRTVDRQLYLAMELLEGPTLAAWLAAAGRLGPADAARAAGELLGALAHAHRHDVLHRDIKPANIVFAGGERGTRVVLIDFGLAQLRDDAAVTATGVCMGSPSYVAPERLLGRPYDARSDLYSVAVVLYEMLAGRPPFVGATPLEIARCQIQDTPRRIGADVPPELDDLLQQALAKDPARRFASAEAMRAALAQALVPAEELDVDAGWSDEQAVVAAHGPTGAIALRSIPIDRGEVSADDDSQDASSTQLALPLTLRGPSLLRRTFGWLRYGAWRWRGHPAHA